MRFLRRLTLGALAFGAFAIAACSEEPKGPRDPILTTQAQPAPATMRRLLARQYVGTVKSIFGSAAGSAARPPTDTSLNGYQSIASGQLSVSDEHASRYEASARAIAEAFITDPENYQRLVDCPPNEGGDDPCYESFIERVGRLAFRRPLDDDERTEFLEVAQVARESMGSFEAGIAFVIVALLQSPSFIYQIEIGDPLGAADGPRKLNGYEMATRLSFFLHDRGPDDALLDAAKAGELDDEAGVRAHAKRMVTRAIARDASMSFFLEYLALGELETMAKDPALFPDYSSELAMSMQRETTELIRDVVWIRDAPITELFTAQYSFLDEDLAALYDVTAPDEPWSSVELPKKQQRGGVLSHASILSSQAHADSTSVTHRGMFVLERFLCQSMPPPPEDVVTELPPSSTAPTMRERVAVHLEHPTCAGCHSLVDPMGLAMENYDPIGRWRERENGEIIDASGETGELGSFVGVAELGVALSKTETATQCMLRNLYRHATGHVETSDERDDLRLVHDKFKASGYSWRTALVELAASPLMRSVGPKEAAEE